MKAKTIHSFKQGGLQTWISRFAILLGVPFLIYIGYCWGWWGRHSLLLQYVFQCNCPPANQEARYPESVDVIVPACRYVISRISPGGRLMYLQDEQSGITYLLDLQTNEKKLVSLPEGYNYFLTDDLIFHSFRDNYFVLDILTGNTYPIQPVRHFQPSVYSMGNVDPNLLLNILLQADQIYFINEVFQPVVALSSDFRTHSEHSFTFNAFDFSAEKTNPVEKFLQENNIVYHFVPSAFPPEVRSPNGKFIARDDGIYLVATNQKIVEGYSPTGFFRPYSGKYFSVRGWTYDGSGVIYSSPFSGPCLLETSFFTFEEPTCLVVVPQPVLKLRVPEQYLSSHGIQ